MSLLEVGGSVKLRGPVEFERVSIGGSLKVEGSLTVKGEFKLGGSGSIKGDLRAEVIRVGGSLSVDGRVDAGEAVIGGSASMGEGVFHELSVGGSLKAGRVKAETARIGGGFSGSLVVRRAVIEKNSKIRGEVIADELYVKRSSEVERAVARSVDVERNAEISYLECVRCRIGRRAWIGKLRYVESYEADPSAEIDSVEKIDSLSVNLDEILGQGSS